MGLEWACVVVSRVRNQRQHIKQRERRTRVGANLLGHPSKRHARRPRRGRRRRPWPRQWLGRGDDKQKEIVAVKSVCRLLTLAFSSPVAIVKAMD